MTQGPDDLYYAAKAADDAFHAALVARYGRSAGDMRYRPDEHTPEIRALGEAKDAADDRWITRLRELQGRR